jgi:hypothetical protein
VRVATGRRTRRCSRRGLRSPRSPQPSQLSAGVRRTSRWFERTPVNDLYFRCETCKRFVDAGYRWANATLVEGGVVRQDDFVHGGTNLPPVSPKAVLDCSEYWSGADESPFLATQLPLVRRFLEAHSGHQLSFGDIHRFHRPECEWLEWLCDDPESNESPRVYAETLGLSSWGDVESYVQSHRPPWWWTTAAARHAARRKFEELVQRVTHS